MAPPNTLQQDMAVVKSQMGDIRDQMRAVNIKLDNMSAYTRQEADDKFASVADVNNIRWLVYTVIGGIVAFFFYIIQAKIV